MRTTRPTAVSACVPAGRSVCHCCFSSGGRVRTYERATNHCSQSSGTREAGALYRSQPVAGSADATPFRQEKPSRPAGRRPTGGGGTVLCSFWAEGRGRERPATPAEPRGRLLPPASSRWERAIPQLPQVLWESRLEAGFQPERGEVGVSPPFHPLKGGGKARSAEADRSRGVRPARTQAAANVLSTGCPRAWRPSLHPWLSTAAASGAEWECVDGQGTRVTRFREGEAPCTGGRSSC